MVIILSLVAGVSLALTVFAAQFEGRRTPVFFVIFICCLLGAIILRGIQ